MAGNHYVGKAGQFAVMAQLSMLGYNVAIPEIDVGDDVFVLNEATGHLDRIQVKTANGKPLTRIIGAYRCQFSINSDHVNDSKRGGSHYIFAAFNGAAWQFLVLDRSVLKHLINVNNLGTATGDGSRMISVVFIDSKTAKSSTKSTALDLSSYLGNWSAWPPQ